jgi:mannose-6-phosphate isomerase-like protein (cupin superfamily)
LPSRLGNLNPAGTHHRSDMALEEFYLILAGTASMRVGQEHHDLRAGDSVLAPAGVEHDLRNTGDDTLRVLVVWGEEGHKDFSAFGSVAKARAARSGKQ